MKTWLLGLVLGLAWSLELSAEDLVKSINEAAGWTASLNWVQTKTQAEIDALFTPKAIKPKKIYKRSWGHLAERLTLPTGFDCREAFPGCISPIYTRQGNETVWQIAAIEVSSDRICAYTSANITDRFSMSYLQACNSGPADLPNTWLYIEENGLPLEACVPPVPYKAACPFACYNLKPLKKFVFRDALEETSALNIKMSLLNSGPVGGVMKVYEDFLYYTGGIYRHKGGKELGETMLRIIGWDTKDGVSYWVCANNWGTGWGEKGYARIAFGQGGIDSAAMTIMPTLL